MALNPTKFQSGMQVPGFFRGCGTKAQCVHMPKAACWPLGGCRSPWSAPDNHDVSHGARKLHRCKGCRHQTSLTPGKSMAHPKLSRTTWFHANDHISQVKTGLDKLDHKRPLGLRYPTAWLLHPKVNRVMAQQGSNRPPCGEVQFNDPNHGEEHAADKSDRTSKNKVPFVATLTVKTKDHQPHLKLKLIPRLRLEAIGTPAQANLTKQTQVINNGFGCFAKVTRARCKHLPIMEDEHKPCNPPQFRRVNLVLGNMKQNLQRQSPHRSAAGTPANTSQHLPITNHRLDPRGIATCLIIDIAQPRPIKKAVIKVQAEVSLLLGRAQPAPRISESLNAEHHARLPKYTAIE